MDMMTEELVEQTGANRLMKGTEKKEPYVYYTAGNWNGLLVERNMYPFWVGKQLANVCVYICMYACMHAWMYVM